jgi:DTW domain-containing protein YfiP
LCDELPSLELRTRVVLVVHHVETHKSTNTGRLFCRMVRGVDVRVRGIPGAPPRPAPAPGKRVVLYPDGAARTLVRDDAADDLTLVVPDGNWSQARRMLNRDPDLVGADVVSLPPGPPSRYGLRRSPRPGTLCTFEAIARAIGILEGEETEAELMHGFERFVERARIVRESGRGGGSILR